ncbi:MAG: oligosaccharide flippase family protein [Bacteroidota bacterium]|nr:oligosaccharide flippase family protein [Bacteroidota bacterium]
MPSAIKRLAGQTAIYGVPTILGRFLQYLLVILLTRVFDAAEYGTISVFYAYCSFLMVVLTYGMETTFFRFTQDEGIKKKVFSTAMISLILTTSLFLILSNCFSRTIAEWIGYPKHPEYVIWFSWILGLDALAAIPFAKLRAQNKPIRFAAIKMINILANIGLTLFWLLLCPYLMKHGFAGTSSSVFHIIYRPEIRIGYVFLANLFASIITLILLFPQLAKIRWEMDPALWKKMMLYAWPLLFAGMAGIVNETFDRLLLRYLLPSGIAEAQVGIYSACYKISILMTIFVQAYRFAAEPFFFAQAKEKDARKVYARIMDYFIIVVSVIFLVTMLYLDDFFIYFIGRNVRGGKGVIPVLLLANLFLGVYYNLSIWYKLISKTIWGAWFSVIGAVITLALNFWWIPLSPDHFIHGYIGSAWATNICYGFMMVLSYLIGQKYYPIRYNLKKFFVYLGLAVILYLLSTLIHPHYVIIRLAINTFILLAYLSFLYMVEKPHLSKSR